MSQPPFAVKCHPVKDVIIFILASVELPYFLI